MSAVKTVFVVALLFLIYCLLYVLLFVGVLCLSLFCYALLCIHFSFAIMLKRKRRLVALLLLSYSCIDTINVLWRFLTVPWIGLQYVIVGFPDHTHYCFFCLMACFNQITEHTNHLLSTQLQKKYASCTNHIWLTS